MKFSDLGKKPVKLQLRLTTMLMLVLVVGLSLAWWRDHHNLQREVKQLRMDPQSPASNYLKQLEAAILEFAEHHHGWAQAQGSDALWINLEGTLVGNTELNRIVDHMKSFDKLRPECKMTLYLNRSRVTKAFAMQLQRDLPHWSIQMTPSG